MMHILSDLVMGELQQMSKIRESSQLGDYLVKTYNKTASLMAKSCRSFKLEKTQKPKNAKTQKRKNTKTHKRNSQKKRFD
jgi:geranylgeranyl pyrophosphate synthase